MIPLLVLAASLATAAAPVPDAFLTFEGGRLVGVDWVDRDGTRAHTRSVLTQSRVLEATVELRADGTAVRSSATLQDAGQPPEAAIEKTFEAGVVPWSEMIPGTLELAVARARALGQPSARLTGASLFGAARSVLVVERLDATDWAVNAHGKRYEVLTDSSGRLLSAALPAYGVTIERRAGFAPARYPLWAADASPPDSAYRAREVAIRAPEGHVLAGTLTVPPGRGPFPAAVLITGLSPSTRDGGRPPWMPLRDLADALTRAELAVLRVDDRGIGKSTGDHAPSTTFDEARDVHTELGWLRAQPLIDRHRVALVGYSEGGLIAPMVAAEDPAVAAIVTLAGPGVPGPELARYQIAAAVAGDSTVAVGQREAEIAKRLAEPLTPREASVLGIDPLAFARRVRCPALIVQGAADLHVPVCSAERLAAAMRAGGDADVTVRLFPGVSHSLLPDPLGLGDGWLYLPGFVTAPDLLRTVAEWLGGRLAVRAPSGRR